jgi:hypothetical protein
MPGLTLLEIFLDFFFEIENLINAVPTKKFF